MERTGEASGDMVTRDAGANRKICRKVFSREELEFLKGFRKPHDVQVFLNEIPYDAVPGTSSPSKVIEERRANCFEGALFAAAALRCLGHEPVIVDMIAENDDDHVVALFKDKGYLGAIAKSNTTILRFREPVYRNLRELVMSYFDMYINTAGEKTLRSYCNPVRLSRFDSLNWMRTDDDLEYIGDYLNELPHRPILNRRQLRDLNRADQDLVDLCFAGSVKEGLFKPQ